MKNQMYLLGRICFKGQCFCSWVLLSAECKEMGASSSYDFIPLNAITHLYIIDMIDKIISQISLDSFDLFLIIWHFKNIC